MDSSLNGANEGVFRFSAVSKSPSEKGPKTPSNDTDAFPPTPAGSTTQPAVSRSKDSTVSVRLHPIRDILDCYFGLRAPLFPAGSLQIRRIGSPVTASITTHRSGAGSSLRKFISDLNSFIRFHCNKVVPETFATVGGVGLSSNESVDREDGTGGVLAYAEAIKAAFCQEYGDEYQVFITDLWTDHTPWPFNQLPRSYNFLVKHETLWKMTYYGTAPRVIHQSIFAATSTFIAREIAQGLMKYQPHIIISVHPLMQHVPLCVLRSKGLLEKIVFTTVITDLSTCHPTCCFVNGRRRRNGSNRGNGHLEMLCMMRKQLVSFEVITSSSRWWYTVVPKWKIWLCTFGWSETMNQRDAKSSAKRKRGESSFSWEKDTDNSQIFDTHGTSYSGVLSDMGEPKGACFATREASFDVVLPYKPCNISALRRDRKRRVVAFERHSAFVVDHVVATVCLCKKSSFQLDYYS
ncbi:unnamed protein product [Microthlaspi erraticum]|uniref:Diacylglycerol glucosyltransferase N-terminal domain-containing protein n=1 Tax=Microthlaspi erraticum TaxID=1685480 RepID=A0A6D2JH34_9BRAS|nr:unnamed protein product [Microthlaspi erraticum]